MTRSKEYQKGEKAGREAGREEGKEEGRRECLGFLRREDAELSRKLEQWLLDRSREKSSNGLELGEQEEMENQESNGHQSIVSRLPPEVLSMAFSHLDSHRLMMVKRVSSQWYDTILSNASLFKVLNLPLNSFRKWDNSILEYFTRKSQNQLEQVILPIRPTITEYDTQEFIDHLSLSASTLHTLSCALDIESYDSAVPLFSDVLRNLQDLRISFPILAGLTPDSRARSSPISSSAPLNQGSSQSLRHLVINGMWFSPSGNYLMKTETVKKRLLTVEYLRLHVHTVHAQENETVPMQSINILEYIPAFGSISDLFSHLTFPVIRTLIFNCSNMMARNEIWPSSIEEFWLAIPEGIQFDYDTDHLSFLESCAPRLRNLRVDSGAFPFRQHLLAELLEKRFDNAEAGLEVDGQPMVFLEKLIISKKHFGKKMVSRLEKVAGKVIDSKDLPDRIEIDLSESIPNESQRDYL